MAFLVFIQIAFRNLWRNPPRTLATLGAIALGVAITLTFYGFMRYTYWGLSESFARSGNGHLQIASSQWFSSSTPEKHRVAKDQLEAIRQKMMQDAELRPLISATSMRRNFSGVIGTANESTIFMGQGVEADGYSHLASWDNLISGTALIDEIPDAIVVGKRLAESIQIKVENPASLMAATDKGQMNALDVMTQGIAQLNSKELDKVFLIVPLETSLQLLQSEEIDHLAIGLHDSGDVEKVLNRVHRILPKDGTLAVRAWYDLADYYNSVKSLYDRIFFFIQIVLFIVTLLAITNTILMSIFERREEFGIMRAMGTQKWLVIYLCVFEALLIAVIGSVLGVSLCLMAAKIIDVLGGIPMPPPPGSSQGYQLKLLLDINGIVVIVALTLASTLVAAGLPAFSNLRCKTAMLLRMVVFFGLVSVLSQQPNAALAQTAPLNVAQDKSPQNQHRGEAEALFSGISEHYNLPSDNFIAEVEFVMKNGDQIDKKVRYRVGKSAGQSLVIDMSSPNGRRMVLLSSETNLWAQNQGARISLRISPAQRLIGQASNGDVVNLRLTEDYQLKDFSRTATEWQLTLLPRHDKATYGKIELNLDASTKKITKIRYFAASGRLLKEALVQYQKVGVKEYIHSFTIQDDIGSNLQTQIIFGRGYPFTFPAAFFSQNRMIPSAEKLMDFDKDFWR